MNQNCLRTVHLQYNATHYFQPEMPTLYTQANCVHTGCCHPFRSGAKTRNVAIHLLSFLTGTAGSAVLHSATPSELEKDDLQV